MGCKYVVVMRGIAGVGTHARLPVISIQCKSCSSEGISACMDNCWTFWLQSRSWTPGGLDDFDSHVAIVVTLDSLD